MAKDNKLSCLEKRDLLNQSVVPIEALVSWGEQYAGMELVHDAVDFFEKANAREGIERLLLVAMEDADVFLFKRLCRVLGREIEREEWLQLAERAEKLRKYRFAAEAYRAVGDEDRAGVLLKSADGERPNATVHDGEEIEIS